jgi:CCR4-NOT transcription complex subunit 2
VADDASRQKIGTFRDDSTATGIDDSTQAAEARNPLGAIGNDPPNGKSKEDNPAASIDGQDPLAGLTEDEKWGIKGLRMLMNNHPDYNAMVVGMDPASLGLDLSSNEYEVK